MTGPRVSRPADAPPLVHAGAPPAGGPRHVAIIMDGNRRWARERGRDEFDGHVAGTDALRDVVRSAAAMGIRHLTVYAFSRENWGRPDDEVSRLFELLAATIERETAELVENGVAVSFLGRLGELPRETAERVAAACARTSGGERLQLHVAFNYASRTEIVDAVRAIVRSGVMPEAIDEAAVASHLYTAGIPDPDLVIRTGGEERLSNFLLWQSAYAEIVSWPGLWPDFTGRDLEAAIGLYAKRDRRFGR